MGDTLIEELQDLQVDPEVEQDTSEELKMRPWQTRNKIENLERFLVMDCLFLWPYTLL